MTRIRPDHSRYLNWVFAVVGLYVLFSVAALQGPRKQIVTPEAAINPPEVAESIGPNLLDEVPDSVEFADIQSMLEGRSQDASFTTSYEPQELPVAIPKMRF